MPIDPSSRPPLAHRLFRWSAGGVIVVLMALSALGAWRLQEDVAEEVRAADRLMDLLAWAAEPPSVSMEVPALVQRLQKALPLRHVAVWLLDPEGQTVWMSREGAPLPQPARPVPLTVVSQPGWHLVLGSDPRDERQEARTNLLGMLAVVVGGALALLAAMRWHLRRELAPMGSLVEAIREVEVGNLVPVHGLPPMPVRELEAIAQALRHLAASLEVATERRRRLGQQMQTLQEAERTQLAQDLHDEMGQRLSSMRVNLEWLVRTLPPDTARQSVVAELARQCEDLQVDIRQLLVDLRPVGPDAAGGSSSTESAARVEALLDALVRSWQSTGTSGFLIDGHWRAPSAETQCAPEVVVALYRLSQEALTNIARHAQATRVHLQVTWDASAGQVRWCVEDDGRGLPDSVTRVQGRGNGLAGMQERVWNLGGVLQIEPIHPGTSRPGLRLQATVPLLPAL